MDDNLKEYEVRLEYPDGSSRTVYVEARDAEHAEDIAVKGSRIGTIPHAFDHEDA